MQLGKTVTPDEYNTKKVQREISATWSNTRKGARWKDCNTQKGATWKEYNRKKSQHGQVQHEKSRMSIVLVTSFRLLKCFQGGRDRGLIFGLFKRTYFMYGHYSNIGQNEKSATRKSGTLNVYNTQKSATWKECNTKKVQHGKVQHKMSTTQKSATWSECNMKQNKKKCNMKNAQHLNRCNMKRCNMKRVQHGKSATRKRSNT